MPQNTQSQFPKVPTIKPNIKKAFLVNLVKILIISGILVGALLYLNQYINIGDFLIIFQVTNVDPNSLVKPILIGASITIAIIVLFTYLALSNIRYEFYSDSMLFYETQLLVLVSSSKIQYNNISRINFEKHNFLNTGIITVELTGTTKKTAKLVYIDNVEQIVQYMDQVIANYRSRLATQYDQNYRIQNILDKSQYI